MSCEDWQYLKQQCTNPSSIPTLPFNPKHSSVPTTSDVPASNSSPCVLTPILLLSHHNVTYWSFPYIISQSTILGRVGSIAFTVIALLFSKMFFHPMFTISCDWESTESDMGPSDSYSRHFSREQHLWLTNKYSSNIWCVRSASSLFSTQRHWLYYGWTWTAIVPERTATASLPFNWRQALVQGHTTSILILSSNTVAFIPTTQGVFLLDSHIHGNSGTHVAFASWLHSFKLLSSFNEINNFQYTLGTVINVKFH